MLLAVRIALALLGISAVLISGSIFILGPHLVAQTAGALLDLILPNPSYSGGLDHPNIDSELRFYAVYWVAFGLWVLQSLWRRGLAPWAYMALGLFWLGGFGRLLGIWLGSGWPDPLFVVLMWIELVAPPIVALALRLTNPEQRA